MILGCNYVIHSIDGSRNIFADYISRHVAPPVAQLASLQVRKLRPSIPQTLADIDPAAQRFRLSRVQPLMQKTLWLSLDELSLIQKEWVNRSSENRFPFGSHQEVLDSGQEIVKVGNKLFVPGHNRDILARLIIIAHSRVGHRGRAQVLRALKDRFFFEHPLDNTMIDQYIRECLHCRPFVVFRPLLSGTLLRATKPLEIIHFDFYFVSSKGLYHYLLVVIDNFTQYVNLHVASTPSADVVVEALLLWYGRIGFLEQTTFVSDNAAHFTAGVIKKLSQHLSANHQFSIAYAPWTNAFVERPNREIKQVLQSLTSEFRLRTSEFHRVHHIAEGILNRLKRRNKNWFCPLALMFKRLEEDIDRYIGIVPGSAPSELISCDVSQYFNDSSQSPQLEEVKVLAEKFDRMHETISEKLQLRQIKHASEHASYFSDRLNFAPGNAVMVLKSKPKLEATSKNKFIWDGPAVIVDLLGQSYVTVEWPDYKRTGKPKTEKVHLSRLAFYSVSLSDVDDNVLDQMLFDTEELRISKIKSLEYLEDGGIGVKVQVVGHRQNAEYLWPLQELYYELPKKDRRKVIEFVQDKVAQKPHEVLFQEATNQLREISEEQPQMPLNNTNTVSLPRDSF